MKKVDYYNFFWLYIKISEAIYYQRNKDELNRAKYYYKRDKERLRENARDEYRNLSEEERIERENMEKINIIICLKKRNKN